MEMLDKLPIDVLIYIQNVRKYFSTNQETIEYFNIENHKEEFFEGVTDLAVKNFEKFENPALSINQFEEVKNKLTKTTNITGGFMNLGNFGAISLN